MKVQSCQKHFPALMRIDTYLALILGRDSCLLRAQHLQVPDFYGNYEKKCYE